jgi:hypothetical protein
MQNKFKRGDYVRYSCPCKRACTKVCVNSCVFEIVDTPNEYTDKYTGRCIATWESFVSLSENELELVTGPVEGDVKRQFAAALAKL